MRTQQQICGGGGRGAWAGTQASSYQDERFRGQGQGGFITHENQPGPGGCCWLLVVLVTPAGGRDSQGRDREGGFTAPRRSDSKSGDRSPARPRGASCRG